MKKNDPSIRGGEGRADHEMSDRISMLALAVAVEAGVALAVALLALAVRA